MLSIKHESFLAPAIQARVLELNANGDLPPYVVVENIGTSASVAIVWQESDDGSTWTDIGGTTKSINPSKSDGQVIVTTKRKIALSAGGGMRLLVAVARQVNGPVSDFGVA